jgi:hypothetical protein
MFLLEPQNVGASRGRALTPLWNCKRKEPVGQRGRGAARSGARRSGRREISSAQATRVIPRIVEYRRRNGRNPKISEVRGAFTGMSRSTA